MGDARTVQLGSLALGGYLLAACLICSAPSPAQSLTCSPPDATSFRTAVAQLRAVLNRNSASAEKIPGPAARVFGQEVQQASSACSLEEMIWELRIVKGGIGNAFSLPDGSVYVDEEMRQLLGAEPGLWAAVLAHEIVHITEHHWTKRAMFARRLSDSGASRFFGEPGALLAVMNSPTALDRQRDLSEFSKQLELEADVGSLELMARSGFHPDFVTALYHLMEAQEGNSRARDLMASHPGWDFRESYKRKNHSAAVAEFWRLWPVASDSPGGPPPMLAFVGRPEVHYASRRTRAEVKLPIRCENSSGPVEVQLVFRRLRPSGLPPREQASKMEQTLDCTADQSLLSFTITAAHPQEETEVDFYVMDRRGWVLARSSGITLRY